MSQFGKLSKYVSIQSPFHPWFADPLPAADPCSSRSPEPGTARPRRAPTRDTGLNCGWSPLSKQFYQPQIHGGFRKPQARLFQYVWALFAGKRQNPGRSPNSGKCSSDFCAVPLNQSGQTNPIVTIPNTGHGGYTTGRMQNDHQSWLVHGLME